MSGEAHGEFIELREEWGSLYDAEYVVRGHVTEDEYRQALTDWWEDYQGEDPPATEPCQHLWARWSITPHFESGLELRLYSEPGRGRFPVTVGEDAFYAEKKRQAEAQRDAARAHLRERFPGAELVDVSANTDSWSLRFKVPGMKYDARLDSSDLEHVLLVPLDLDAWHAYDATREVKADA